MLHESIVIESHEIEIIDMAPAQTVRAEIKSDYEIERNKPMPNRIHGVIQSSISHLLLKAYADRFQFPAETSLDTFPSSTPDICIFPIKKLDWKTIEAKEKEMPITTIEIISPSQTIEYLADKATNLYFPAGVRSAWIVMPPLKTITILSADGQQTVFGSGLLTDPATGIEISVDAVFECLI